MKRFFAVAEKEFIQIRRDKRTLIMVLIMPALLLLLFGYVLSFDVKHIQTGIFDQDHSELSRQFIHSISVSGYFDIKKFYTSRNEIDQNLDRRDVSTVIIIPSTFEKSIKKGERVWVQVLIDGANSQVGSIIQGYIKAFTLNYSLKIMKYHMGGMGKWNIPVTLEPRIWYNPELKSSIFLIPGIIVFILMIICTISISLSIVREKEHGTIEQILISPLNSTEIILGKALPYALIALVSTTIILLVGYIFFDLRLSGSYLLILGTSVLFIFAALGQGILISTFTKSQQVAYMLASLSTILPSLLLSGFIFPIRNMPIIIQGISYTVPARYFVTILREILVKGAGIEYYIKEVIALFIFAFFVFGFAIVRMSKAKLY